MKKILILSYHFPPMNVIASQRALGYANHFKKFGFEPTILTYDWNKSIEEQYCLPSEFNRKITLEENEKYKVYRLPVIRHKRSKLLGRIEKSKLNKLGILIAWFSGHLDTTATLLDYKLSERRFLSAHLPNNKYDAVMGVFSPHFHLSNCSWIGRKFGAKYTLDYRDLWNNRVTREDYKPIFFERVQDYWSSFWWRKWSKNSKFQTIVSEYWARILEQNTKVKSFEITNGFELKESNFDVTPKKTDVFRIVSTGTVYPYQDLSILLEGITMFLKSCESTSLIEIHFVGMIKSNVDNQFWQDKVSQLLNGYNYKLTQRVSRQDALRIQKESGVLIFPTVPNEPGFYSGKVFEYISSGKPVLVSPRDKFGVSKLIETTKTGVVGEDALQVSDYLNEQYKKWKLSGVTHCMSDKQAVKEFSRESQTGKLRNILIKHID